MQTIYQNESNGLIHGVRIGSSASLGILVTAGLFLLMYSLIALEPPELVDGFIKIQAVVLEENRDITPQPEPMEEKPQEVEPEPDTPDFEPTFDSQGAIDIALTPQFLATDIDLTSGSASGSAVPVVRVAPPYPPRAMRRGIEGFVDLMFDISASGKTENIRVIYAEPKGYFEKASKKTLAKWKYKPAFDEDVAIPQKNQTTRITYELDK